ncbi:MAG: chromosome segregation protein SMC, partial [Clostridiales Family XIII bacterium]|nr:chromosome segregation protein SMC [Clostridiales Family XIII bacterium]
MYFKRLIISGFKSFAEPTTIEFLDGLTCVVGPNGSGKSNISDALRWVLGEQSVKSIRGGKMEEIIFSGTADRRQKSMAEVTVIIDNSAKILPIEYEEVSVKRRYYRSSESEYFINGTKVRLKDIKNLFMDTGIGVSGYSIISQGKIQDIISEKKDNLKDIFNEAAGVTKYKTEKESAERKIEKTNINLNRINDIIKELEGRVEELSIESEKAKEYKEISEKHKKLEINIILKNIDKFEKKTLDLEKELSDLKNILDEKNKYKESLKNEKESLKEEREIVAENIVELQNAKRDLDIKVIEAEKNKELREEKLKKIDADKERIKQEIKELKESLNEEIAEKDKREKKQTDLGKEYENISVNLEEKTKANEYENEKYNSISKRIEENKTLIFELSTKKTSNNAAIETTKILLSNFEEELKKEGIEGDEDIERKTLEEALRKAGESKKSKKGELDSFEIEKKNAFEKLKDLSEREEQFRERLNEAEKLISDSLSRKNALEEILNSRENLSQGAKAVLDADIKGVYGTVYDLIKVPKGYELAIETAIGNALQNIICENDDVAKAAIKYLKEYRAGRASFLPLNSLKWTKKGNANLFSNEKGFDDIAINIVSFDEKFEKAFSYLLDGIVVVDNIDNAIRISKNEVRGYRYVSLEGDLILGTGVITGGKYKGKGENLLSKKTEINTLSDQIKELENRKNDIENSINNIISSKKVIEEKLLKIDTKLRELSEAIAIFNWEYKTAEERLSNYIDGKNKKADILQTLKTDRDKHIEKLDNLKKETEDLSKKILETEEILEEDILNFEKQKSGGDTVNKELSELAIKLAEISKEREFADLDLKNIMEVISDINADIKNKEENLNNVLAEEKELNEKKVEEDLINSDEIKKENLEKIKENENKKKEIEFKEKDKGYELEKLLEELENIRENNFALEIDKGKNEARLNSLKERIFEDFSMSIPEAFELKIEDFIISKAEKENREIKRRLEELGTVNLLSIPEYDRVKKRYEFLTAQRKDVLESLSSYEKIVQTMEKEIKSNFKNSFETITDNFKNIFQKLFGGGKGDIILTTDDNPFEAAVEIFAMPPGKKLTNMNLLSGGEKALTAIALMFALLQAKPTPFCILDEVDAALD